MGLTTDPNDPTLGHGVDAQPRPQQENYLVLPPAASESEFVRPVRDSYVHKTCGTLTRMARGIAETYAKDPKFYGSTYCCGCQKHLPVSEFLWDGTDKEVGT